MKLPRKVGSPVLLVGIYVMLYVYIYIKIHLQSFTYIYIYIEDSFIYIYTHIIVVALLEMEQANLALPVRLGGGKLEINAAVLQQTRFLHGT